MSFTSPSRSAPQALIFLLALALSACASGTNTGGGGGGGIAPYDGGTGGSGSDTSSTGGVDAGATQDATPTCQDPCAPDSTTCTAAGLIRTCVKGPTGCWHLSDPSACPSPKICSGTTCVKNCTDDCTAGAKECKGSGARECAVGTDGCAHWGSPTACTGGTVCVGGTCGNCSSHAQCDDLSVCHTGKCLKASGLTYTFTFVSAAIPLKDGDGYAWDPFGGAPDAKMRLFKGDDVICTTSPVQDDYAPVWNEACSTTVTVSDAINFTMVETDGFSDDNMEGHTFTDTIGMLKSGGGTLDLGNKTMLTWKVAPK